MLLDHFFTIENFSKKDNSGIITIKINKEHKVFSGHFPDNPVVPGVFTLQMIKECIEVLVQSALQYKELLNCKFTNMIIPEDNQAIQIEYSMETGTDFRLNATVRYEDTTYLILKAILAKMPA